MRVVPEMKSVHRFEARSHQFANACIQQRGRCMCVDYVNFSTPECGQQLQGRQVIDALALALRQHEDIDALSHKSRSRRPEALGAADTHFESIAVDGPRQVPNDHLGSSKTHAIDSHQHSSGLYPLKR